MSFVCVKRFPLMEDAIVEIADGEQRKELLECWQRLQKAIAAAIRALKDKP